MNKDLSIIIPTYNDSIKEIKCSLDSITLQNSYDSSKIEIIIIDDNTTIKSVNWNKILKLYPQLNIKYIKLLENKGPGNARQVGLDNAIGDFIFFLDCGDSLFDSTVLEVFNSKKTDDCDIISTKLYDEETKTKRRSYLLNNAFIFGIFIKRKFLIENNIRFSEILRWEEDAYFEDKIRFYYPKIVSTGSTIGYSYNVNSNSITRRNNHEYQNNFSGFSAMVVKSILICDFYKNEKAFKEMINEAIRILSVCYSRFYSYIFQNNDISERISKILYLLKILIIIVPFNINSEEFRQLFVKNIYQRNLLKNNYQVPYDKIKDFMNIVCSYENLYDDYDIEGTNISINNFIEEIGIKNNKISK